MHLKVLLAFLTTVAITETINGCKLVASKECNHIKMVEGLIFHAFIPKNEWEDHCRDMDTVLKCIYQPKYVAGCTLNESLLFDMHRSLSNAVCHDGEYLKHIDCLGNKELGTHIFDSCIRFDGNVGCDIFKSIKACTAEKMPSICGDQDKKYLDYLAFVFLEPISKLYKCEMDEPVFEPEIKLKAPTTTAMTSKTMSTKSSMGTTTEEQDTTTPGAGSILKAPSLLIFTVLLIKNL